MTMPLPTTMPAPVPTGPVEAPSGGSARAGRAVPSAPDAPASGGGEFDDAVAAALLAVLGGALPTPVGAATVEPADCAPVGTPVTRGRMTATPATTGPLPGPATGTPTPLPTTTLPTTTLPTTTLPTTATATPTPAVPAGATGPAPTPPVTVTSAPTATPTTAPPQPAPAPAATTQAQPPTAAAMPNAGAAQPVPIDAQPVVASHRPQPAPADDAGTQTGPNGTLTVVPAQGAPAAGQPTTAAAGATGPTATPAAIPAPPHEQVAHVLGPLRHAPDGSYHLTVHLHPADLGSVDVSVSLRDGTVTMQLHADDATARDLLRDSLGELRRELENAGLRAGELGVGAGGAGDRRGSDQRDGPDGGTRAIRVGPTAPAGVVPTDAAAQRARPLRPRSDLLDVHL